MVGGSGKEYILTLAQLLELMDKDQLTWQGSRKTGVVSGRRTSLSLSTGITPMPSFRRSTRLAQ